MRISAKADYGIRALIELAALEEERDGPVKRDHIGQAQEIPVTFLENILLELKRAGIVRSVRGQAGGFRLAREPERITLAEIIRALDGPLASVRGTRPEALSYTGRAAPLRDVWVAVRGSVRAVLEETTLADLLAGELPPAVRALADSPEAWEPH
ncbi:MAG TPA: Rrf2 family transcriptional regulator [Miltoncostaeaceae bacterium]|nr:Rrf2 family transcriptional regulator [Miltoncostaeaceae bacterium]